MLYIYETALLPYYLPKEIIWEGIKEGVMHLHIVRRCGFSRPILGASPKQCGDFFYIKKKEEKWSI
jgi:hypothetical protein